MSRQYEKLEKCYEYYRSVTDFVPRVGLILGSGLGGYAKNMKVEMEIPYGDIPDFRSPPCRGMTESSCWDILEMCRWLQ